MNLPIVWQGSYEECSSVESPYKNYTTQFCWINMAIDTTLITGEKNVSKKVNI